MSNVLIVAEVHAGALRKATLHALAQEWAQLLFEDPVGLSYRAPHYPFRGQAVRWFFCRLTPAASREPHDACFALFPTRSASAAPASATCRCAHEVVSHSTFKARGAPSGVHLLLAP